LNLTPRQDIVRRRPVFRQAPSEFRPLRIRQARLDTLVYQPIPDLAHELDPVCRIKLANFLGQSAQ
jgi:hypothetical protein